MIGGTLRTVAAVACLIVVASWGLFAVDESRAASRETQSEIAGTAASRTADPSPEQERAREREHSGAREAIDDADDVLVAPFAGLVDGAGSQWVRRSVPALLALLVYGLGLTTLARFVQIRS